MKPVTLSFLLGLASLTNLATARTDMEGCVSTEVIIEKYYASYLWYVPDSGEICSFLDCGGGRAPPKTTQPGCPQYTGTETLTPDYLEGWGPSGKKQAASTSTVASTASSTDIVLASATQTSESDSSSPSASSTQATDSMITASPSGLGAVATSLKVSTSSETGDATSTSAAATSSSTFNAAATPASNIAGVVAVMAAVVGAMVL
ncbi:hypothetical protein N7463_006765 [Penicillium fimorum]|uniref:Siderophore biosynthesis enzyme n=1 Tax=Penicillium fimorum TaxID=1882269 RepID=A0A9W9XVX5_9EURO|nr:hypothetical protein N7463_006765 [Penicillium fimorum]